MLPDPFYKTNITWIPKPHKDITRKENDMDMDKNSLTKYERIKLGNIG